MTAPPPHLRLHGRDIIKQDGVIMARSHMSEIPFYKDHWVNIEQARLDRYSVMFEWNPASKALYEPADIRAGHVVAEFGCGPGHTATEIAAWVGPKGHVHALDINASFLEQVEHNARKAGLEGRITTHRSDGLDVPLATESVERLTTRNTLIYVDDPWATLMEFRRVLRPAGRFHAIEGDWPMMVVEPIPTHIWQALVSAASRACRTPDIGRKLTGYLARAGYRDIDVQVITRADRTGRLLSMIKNMAGYAMESDDFSGDEVSQLLAALDQALVDGTYLVLAPQFVVTATR